MPVKDTIAGFKEVIAGNMDHIPEQAFYMVGNLDEVMQKADAMSEGRPNRAADGGNYYAVSYPGAGTGG